MWEGEGSLHVSFLCFGPASDPTQPHEMFRTNVVRQVEINTEYSFVVVDG